MRFIIDFMAAITMLFSPLMKRDSEGCAASNFSRIFKLDSNSANTSMFDLPSPSTV